MRSHPLLILTLIFACLGFSCQKNEAASDPCEGLLNESQPKIAGILFVDKETGENIIVTNNLDTTDIKVAFDHNGTSYKDYQIVHHAETSPINGAVVFYVPEKEDIYLFNIQVGDFGTVKFSYTVSEEENDDKCRPHVYPVSDVKTVNYPFEHFDHEHLPSSMTLLRVAL